MKISVVATKDAGGDTDSPIYHYSCCVFNCTEASDTNSPNRVPSDAGSRDEYDKSQLGRWSLKLKCLAILQLLCGLVIVGVQCYATYWSYYLDSTRSMSLRITDDMYDGIAPGVWAGAVVALVGIFGLIASRGAAKGMVICYMFLNGVVLAFAVTLVVLSSLSTSELIQCKVQGSWVSPVMDMQTYRNELYEYQQRLDEYNDAVYLRQNPDDEERVDDVTNPLPPPPTPPSSPAPMVVLGETVTILREFPDNKFYCESEIFTHWLMAEGGMIFLSFISMIVSIGVIVLGSKANCSCCRTCCGPKAKRVEEDDDRVLLISPTHPGNIHI